MSAANPSRAASVRNLTYTVRLAPFLVETICELARATRHKAQARTEISGLLFGSSEAGLTVVDALKTFKDSGPRSDLARRERLDKAFAAAAVEAAKDAELATLKLVGWFSLRGSSGLLNSDIDFHNRHFKNSEDLALVIWRETETQAIAEIYSKAEGSRLSSDEYRWSSVRLSTEMRRVSEPIDLAMRARVSEETYLKPYQTSASQKQDEWTKVATSVRRAMHAFLPGKQKTEAIGEPASQTDLSSQVEPAPRGQQSWDAETLFRRTGGAPPPYAPDSAREPNRIIEPENAPAVRARGDRPEEVSGLPMVISSRRKPAPMAPWISISLVFLLFSSITFAVLAILGLESGSGKLAQIVRVIFPGTDLGVHVDSQGDKLLLSWNRRNPAVATASDAVLQIFDGAGHREIRLDSGQVANGAVLYKPVSNDVTFRLEIHGNDHTTVMGSLRVLDATASGGGDHGDHTLDLSKPGPIGGTEVGAAIEKPSSERLSRPVAGGRRRVIDRNSEIGRVSVPVPLPGAQTDPRANTTPPAESPTLSGAGQSAFSVSAPNVAPPVTGSVASNGAQPDSKGQSATSTADQRGQAFQSGPQPPSAAGSTINGWDPNVPENRSVAAPLRDVQTADNKTGSFVSPRPLLQVMPNAKLLPAGAVPEVSRVEVQVRIDVNGQVIAARVLNEGNVKSALANAAVSAARQWTFQPATLGGEKITSDHTILFEFRPETQPAPQPPQ